VEVEVVAAAVAVAVEVVGRCTILPRII